MRTYDLKISQEGNHMVESPENDGNWLMVDEHKVITREIKRAIEAKIEELEWKYRNHSTPHNVKFDHTVAIGIRMSIDHLKTLFDEGVFPLIFKE